MSQPKGLNHPSAYRLRSDELQLWSADCDLVRGEDRVRGQLIVDEERVFFREETRRFFGLGGVSHIEQWTASVFEVDGVRTERRTLILDLMGGRASFYFRSGNINEVRRAVAYALDVARKQAKRTEFTMRNLMKSYMEESHRKDGK
jgi:hypothetical protein